MIDAWTDRILQFTDQMTPESDNTLMDLFEYTNNSMITRSHPQLHYSNNMVERVKTAKITDFLGNRLAMKLLSEVPDIVLEEGSSGGGSGEGSVRWVQSTDNAAHTQQEVQHPVVEERGVLAIVVLVAAGLLSALV